MSNRHHIIRPKELITETAWAQHFEPLIDQLESRPGGCITLTLEVDPMQQNFVVGHLNLFQDAERKLIRKAIVRQRAKVQREAKHQ